MNRLPFPRTPNPTNWNTRKAELKYRNQKSLSHQSTITPAKFSVTISKRFGYTSSSWTLYLQMASGRQKADFGYTFWGKGYTPFEREVTPFFGWLHRRLHIFRECVTNCVTNFYDNFSHFLASGRHLFFQKILWLHGYTGYTIFLYICREKKK